MNAPHSTHVQQPETVAFPAPKVQDHHSHIPTHAHLLNTKCNVQVACAHHPHVLAASSSAQRLLKRNNACRYTQLATPHRARSLQSENYVPMVGWNYLGEAERRRLPVFDIASERSSMNGLGVKI